jgi:hypothetical protein
MSVTLQLTGYDKNSDVLRVEHALPKRVATAVKRIAGVAAEDPDVLGSYPLTERQVIDIAGAAGTPLNPRLYNYFLEGYEP